MSYCPHCNNTKSEVLETRRYKDYENWTQRTRKCYNCSETFKTLEITLGDLEQIARGENPEQEIIFDAGLED